MRTVPGIAWISVLLLFSHGQCGEPDFTRHSGHGQEEQQEEHEYHDSIQVTEPLHVNCSIPVCDGPLKDVYCIGPILSASWQFGMQGSCPGSKLKFPADQVLANFKKLVYPIDQSSFASFCKENFDNVKYLEQITFPDWKENPDILTKIPDVKRRKLALEVNRRWNELGRKFNSDVVSNPSLYPVTLVSNPFVVPGGDFDIYFYWDSYWVIEGLLVSNMTTTARGIISNFVEIVKKQGFIPNSGKLQLSSRTQPPLFTQMLYEYFLATGDTNFTLTTLPTVEKELAFWETNRLFTVNRNGVAFNVFQYKSPSNCPRPENFLLDYWQGMNSSRRPEDVWSSTASACESGWDFSSRWFDWSGTNAYSKKSIHTNTIVPVDLNAFMAWNYRAVAIMYKKLNNTSKVAEYRTKFNTQLQLLDKFFWDEKEGIWLDYDVESSTARNAFYPSNVFPLLVIKPTGEVIKRVGEYLERNSVFTMPGGIPSTLPVNSTEQWDFPNVWAPTLHIFVLSLLSTRDAYLVQKAKETADRFTSTVYQGMFEPPQGTTAGIWEKYDARKADGSRGGGGEYPVQEGFGWTNGAVLHLIMMFDQPSEWGIMERMLKLESDSSVDTFSSMFGDAPHNIIVGTLIAICLLIAIIFTMVSYRNLRKFIIYRTDPRRREERRMSQRLLDDVDVE